MRTKEKPVLPNLVKDKVILEKLGISRMTLHELMNLEENPIPYTKIGRGLFFVEEEVAVWFEKWRKLPKSKQEVLKTRGKETTTRQGGRLSVLQRGRESLAR